MAAHLHIQKLCKQKLPLCDRYLNSVKLILHFQPISKICLKPLLIGNMFLVFVGNQYKLLPSSQPFQFCIQLLFNALTMDFKLGLAFNLYQTFLCFSSIRLILFLSLISSPRYFLMFDGRVVQIQLCMFYSFKILKFSKFLTRR